MYNYVIYWLGGPDSKKSRDKGLEYGLKMQAILNTKSTNFTTGIGTGERMGGREERGGKENCPVLSKAMLSRRGTTSLPNFSVIVSFL